MTHLGNCYMLNGMEERSSEETAAAGAVQGPNLEVGVRGWEEGLRSSNYRQGVEALRDNDDRYCCLGVACEIAIINGLGLVALQRGGERSCYTYGPADVDPQLWPSDDTVQYSFLPTAVWQWMGLPGENPVLQVPPQVVAEYRQAFLEEHGEEPDQDVTRGNCTATELNDDAKLTFEQIADCIQYTFRRDVWDARHAEKS